MIRPVARPMTWSITRWAFPCVLASSSIALAQTPPPAPHVERSRLEVQPVANHPIKSVSINNPLGDVTIEGYDGTSILIETRKQGPDEEALDRLRVSLVPNPDGAVRITTTADRDKESRKLLRSAVRIDLVIRAPHAARVDAAVSAGKLEVSKMDGGGELDTASGPISVSNVQGDFETHTVSGPTSLSVVFGSVDAQTLHSNVDLDTIGGERLVASATRGTIAGRRVRSRNVELTTTDGKIVLEAEAALRGRLVVSSLKGDVEVRLRRHGMVAIRARGAKVNLGSAGATAKAHNGWIESQLGEKQAANDIPAMVEMRSRLGMVQFTIVE